MWKSRVTYLLVLLCVGVFFVCFNGYLSLYLLVLSLLLPVVSLIISLPSMLGVRVSLSAGQGDSSVPGARKGDSIPLELEVWNTTPFSSGRAKALLTVRNTFSGQRERERFLFTTSPQRQLFQHQLTSQTCGQVVCRVEHLWVCDHLGLFALPVRCPREVTVYFWPTVHPLELECLESSTPDSEGERYSQKKPGDDPTELFALREYQEGDRLSRVHWKLSQKLGRTLVKELGLPLSDHLLFLLDLSGDGLEADALLDALASLSAFLAEGEHAHRVLYWSPGKEQFRCQEVTQFQDLLPLWQELLASGSHFSFPPLGEEVLPTGISHGIYLCRAPQAQPLLVLENKFPSARLTVIQTCPEETKLPGEVRPASLETVLLKPGQIPQSLNGLVL